MRVTLDTSWDIATKNVRLQCKLHTWSLTDSPILLPSAHFAYALAKLFIWDTATRWFSERNITGLSVQIPSGRTCTFSTLTHNRQENVFTIPNTTRVLSVYIFHSTFKHLPEYSQMVTLSDPIILWTISRITGCVMEIFTP